MKREKYKVLIVEDQAITAMEIKQILTGIDLNVIGIAKSSIIAIKKFKEYLPDIVIMDIDLDGDIDGISTVEELYKINNTNIVYLTAFSDDATIDKAIKTNPLAYEIKPFHKASLVSTIKVVLAKLNKDKKEKREENFNLGYGYNFNMEAKELFYENTLIKIGKKEAHLLYLLVNSKGQILTNDFIELQIWEGNFTSESSLRTLIWRLRTRLEHKIIETIPCQGIRLVIPK